MEIVDAFLDEAPERLEELAVGLASADAVVVARAAHTLKSNAATFGATELERICRELETVARTGDLTPAGALAAQVPPAWAAIVPALTRLRAAAHP